MTLGEEVWDEMFAEGSFDLPPTRFIEKVKQAVTEEDFQHIKREILNTLKDEKITSAEVIIPHSQRPKINYTLC